MPMVLTEGAVVAGISAEQQAGLKTGLDTAGSGIMSSFIGVLPALGGLVAISFAIYLVRSKLKSLGKGR